MLLLLTFLATSSLGIEMGIGIGVALSLGLLIFRTSSPHIAELGKVKGTNTFRNILRFSDLETYDDIIILRPDAQLYFANIDSLKETVEEKIEGKPTDVKYLILNAESVSHMDSTAVQSLRNLNNELSGRGITLLLSGVIGPVRDILEKSHLVDDLGKEHFFMNLDNAVKYATGKGSLPESKEEITLQSYH
jgi:SulP family sulfate permease